MIKLKKDHWLLNKPIAHRGLFNNKNIPENSYSAYEEAIKNGYPIEMDIQMSVDGYLVCFHDDNVKRMCGIDKDIRDMTLEEIKSLNLLDTDQKIPIFDEFLKFIDNRTPILIEVKHQKNKGIESKIIDYLKDYKGDYAIQSFIPYIMKRIRKLSPNSVCGMLTTQEYSPLASKFVNWCMRNYIFKIYVHSDFYNVRVKDLIITQKHLKNKIVICWTVKNKEDELLAKKYCKNFIFEDYEKRGCLET